MRKTLTYSSFVITSLLVILAFVTATTYTQLGVAIILYPLLTFFAYKLFMIKNDKVPTVSFQSPAVKPAKKVKVEKADTANAEKLEETVVKDIDKRAFLKLIGATGISFFLFSLFNRRTGAQFFGSSAGPGITALTDGAGNKINPSESQPTDSYQITEIDDSFVAFYGFTNKNGAWFIMKEDPGNGSFRYIKGESDFSGNWVNRKDLNYDYYHKVF